MFLGRSHIRPKLPERIILEVTKAEMFEGNEGVEAATRNLHAAVRIK